MPQATKRSKAAHTPSTVTPCSLHSMAAPPRSTAVVSHTAEKLSGLNPILHSLGLGSGVLVFLYWVVVGAVEVVRRDLMYVRRERRKRTAERGSVRPTMLAT